MTNAYLHVGGLVAVGFDESEQYLLTVSHSGRGVFRTSDWARVARDVALAYPENGVAVGIGPIDGVNIDVTELDSEHDILLTSRSGKITLHCESSGIAVSMTRPTNCGGRSKEVSMNWNKWIRQTHRWVSIIFTLTVIANFVALALTGGAMPPPWVTYSPLLPLALLLLTGLYVLVLPYTANWRGAR